MNDFSHVVIRATRRSGYVSALLLLLLPIITKAQDSLSSVREVEEVVITAQHGGGGADQAVHRVRVVDRERLEAQAAQTLPDILQTELGIQMTQDPATGTKLQVQGLAGQHVKILVDGVPVVGRLDGDIDLSQLPLHNIERIEIIEGPLSVEYGSNALGGVINLITKTAAEQRLEIAATLFDATTGPGWSQHEGIHNVDGGITWRRGQHEAGVQGGRYFFGGRFDESSIRNKSWNPKRQAFASGHYRWLGERGSLRLRSQMTDELLLRQGASQGIYEIFALDEEVTSIRQQHQLDGNYSWQNQWEWKGFVALSALDRTREQVRVDLVSLAKSPLPDASNEYFGGLSARGTFTRAATSGKLSLRMGYDLLRESVTGDKILNEYQVQHDLAAFSSVEYRPVSALTLRPGVRVTYHDAYPAPATPSFNVKWDLGKELTWRASWARGFRAPSLKELYLDFVDVNHNLTGNADLLAEYGQYWQTSAAWKKVKQDALWRAGMSLFYNRVNNQIELAVSDAETNAFTYFNLTQSELTGGRAEASFRRERFFVQLGSNLLLRKTPDNVWLPSAQANATMQVGLPAAISLNVFYKFSGPSQTFQLGASETEVVELARLEAYHWMDLSLQRSFFDKGLVVTAGGKNLLDVTSVAATGSTGGTHSSGSGAAAISYGRSIFFSLSWKLDHQLK